MSQLISLPSNVVSILNRGANNFNHWIDRNLTTICPEFPNAVLESPEAGNWREDIVSPLNHVYMDMLWSEIAKVGMRINSRPEVGARLYVSLCRRDWFDNGESQLIEIYAELYDGSQWFRIGEQYLPVEKASRIPVVLHARISSGTWETIQQHEVDLGEMYDVSRINWHWDNPFVTLCNFKLQDTFIVPTLLRQVKRLNAMQAFQGIAEDHAVLLAIDCIDEAAVMAREERTKDFEDMVIIKLRDAIAKGIIERGFQVEYPNGNHLRCEIVEGEYWLDGDTRELKHVTIALYTPAKEYIDGDELQEIWFSNMSEHFAVDDYNNILEAFGKRLLDQNNVSGLGKRIEQLWAEKVTG